MITFSRDQFHLQMWPMWPPWLQFRYTGHSTRTWPTTTTSTPLRWPTSALLLHFIREWTPACTSPRLSAQPPQTPHVTWHVCPQFRPCCRCQQCTPWTRPAARSAPMWWPWPAWNPCQALSPLQHLDRWSQMKHPPVTTTQQVSPLQLVSTLYIF